jgi:hypothetical protein
VLLVLVLAAGDDSFFFFRFLFNFFVSTTTTTHACNLENQQCSFLSAKEKERENSRLEF